MIKTSIELINDALKSQNRIDYRSTCAFLYKIIYDETKKYPIYDQPVIYIISGGVAAGKSTLCYNFLKYFSNVDIPFLGNDTIYEMLFKGKNDFDTDYNNARQFVDNALDKLINKGISFIWETVFSKDKKVEVLKKLKENNYKIVCLFVGVEIDTSIARSKNREESGGNIVKEDFIIDRYHKVNNYFSIIRPYFDELYLFSNEKDLHLLYAKDSHRVFENKNMPKWAKELLNYD